MEHHSIITQVAREDEALTCQPASEKGNVRRVCGVCGLRRSPPSDAAAFSYRKNGGDFSLPSLDYLPIAFAEKSRIHFRVGCTRYFGIILTPMPVSHVRKFVFVVEAVENA